MSNPDINLFRDEEFEEVKLTPEKVVCLGMEFESDDARRAYFREELRKKLPELRQIEGFPIGEDEDIINLSDPPYYTACPNPWLNDFITEWEKEKVELERQGKRNAEFEVNEPYASDVSEGKNNPIYDAHSYYTKVPHPAIMRYILHYTQPGDIVFDGFCGTGMTGVAAAHCACSDSKLKLDIESDFKINGLCHPVWGNRHSICSDLSPAATFLASNFTNIPSPTFKSDSEKVLNQYKQIIKDLYYISYKGVKCEISYILYSDVYICSSCQKELLYVGDIFKLGSKESSSNAKCPYCNCNIKANSLERVYNVFYDTDRNETRQIKKIVPAIIGLKYNSKIINVNIDDLDESYIDKLSKIDINQWVPSTRTPEGGEGRRNDRVGILYIDDFYTKENKFAVSELYKIVKDQSIFKFGFLNTCWHATIMRRYNEGGGHRPKTGTLYIPSISSVGNVYNIYKKKLSQLEAFQNYIAEKKERSLIQVASCTKLNIKSNSIDYIFTDPPFGANISYSELNCIWESWLKVATNSQLEAIENKSVNKDSDYYSELMAEALKEYYRILKPGKWITIEFSNTSSIIWNIITNSIKKAGFIIANVSALDKKQGSISAYTTTTAVKQDLVITSFKPTNELIKKLTQSTDGSVNAMDFIEELLYHLPVHLEKNNSTTAVIERSPKILYDRLISYYVQHGYAIPMDAQEFQKALRDRFIERDGMFFTASQTIEYEAKKEKTNGVVPMALFISSEAEGIEWLKRELAEPQTYQEILPNWMKDMVAPKKGDVLPELAVILEENFIKDEDGKWRKPDAEKAADLEILRGKKLMKEFNLYLEQASKPKAKRMKDTRLEVLRYGFKECYKQKNYQAIVTVGDHIQESLLQEDEVLLQYYDIASMRV